MALPAAWAHYISDHQSTAPCARRNLFGAPFVAISSRSFLFLCCTSLVCILLCKFPLAFHVPRKETRIELAILPHLLLLLQPAASACCGPGTPWPCGLVGWGADFQARYHQPATRAAAAEYAALATRVGLSSATLVQAWAASRWYMASVIIGATTMEQLKENIAACQVGGSTRGWYWANCEEVHGDSGMYPDL